LDAQFEELFDFLEQATESSGSIEAQKYLDGEFGKLETARAFLRQSARDDADQTQLLNTIRILETVKTIFRIKERREVREGISG
jgi:hypothetical protein